jgi:hypothetical protein
MNRNYSCSGVYSSFANTPYTSRNSPAINANTQSLTLQNHSTQLQNSFECSFFCNPPNDPRIYHINCKEITLNNDINTPHNNNAYHVFCHQLSTDKFYQITCQMISHASIVQFLNEKLLGIKFKQNVPQQQERLEFSNTQRVNLESHLKQILFNYMAPRRINENPSYLNTIKRNDPISNVSYPDAGNNSEGIIQSKL